MRVERSSVDASGHSCVVFPPNPAAQDFHDFQYALDYAVQTDDVDSAVLRTDSGSQGSQGNHRGQESRSTQGSRKDPRRAGKAKFAKGAIEAKDAYEIPGLAWDIN